MKRRGGIVVSRGGGQREQIRLADRVVVDRKHLAVEDMREYPVVARWYEGDIVLGAGRRWKTRSIGNGMKGTGELV